MLYPERCSSVLNITYWVGLILGLFFLMLPVEANAFAQAPKFPTQTEQAQQQGPDESKVTPSTSEDKQEDKPSVPVRRKRIKPLFYNPIIA